MTTEATSIWTQPNESRANAQLNFALSNAIYIMTSIIGCLGLLGNLFVIIVIFNYTKMRKQLTCLLIINQSIIDALASLILIININTWVRGRPLYGVSGVLLCQLWSSGYLLWSSLMASTVNLVCLSLERYIAIIYPIWHKTIVTRNMVLVAAGGVWIVGFLAKLPNTALTAGINDKNMCAPNSLWPGESVKKTSGIINIVISLIVPLLLLIYCYTRMFISLRTRVAPTERTSNQRLVESKSSKATRNVFKTLMVKHGRNPSSGDNYDKKRENNKKREM